MLILFLGAVNGSIISDPHGFTLDANSSRIVEGFLSGCACTSSKRGFNSVARKCVDETLRRYNGAIVFAFDLKKAAKEYRKAATASFEECSRKSSHESVINAEAVLRRSNKIPMCPYDVKTGKNLAPVNNGTRWKSTGKCSTSSVVSALSQAVNQGCIATQHLRGFKTQYKRDLQRHVLCNEGFCATHYHALEFHGRLTNMDELCNRGEWQGLCSENFTWVNNLAVWSSRRAIHEQSGIVFTPYDTRFPWYLTWISQIILSGWFASSLGIFVLGCSAWMRSRK